MVHHTHVHVHIHTHHTHTNTHMESQEQNIRTHIHIISRQTRSWGGMVYSFMQRHLSIGQGTNTDDGNRGGVVRFTAQVRRLALVASRLVQVI